MALSVPVVPLLETEVDLNAGPAILQRYLKLEPVRLALAKVQHLTSTGAELASMPIAQQVMIGYSDSNKDAGFAAGPVLYRAERAIADAVKDVDAQAVFFHGRGGTASRGGGPTQHFLNALPSGSSARRHPDDRARRNHRPEVRQLHRHLLPEQLQASTVAAGVFGSYDQAAAKQLERPAANLCRCLVINLS